ncbi:phospholipase D family protein [Bradyrhizobium diazoefficiens]
MKLASGRVLDRLPAEERCLGALFTSYSFDPAFFEEHVLRAVLRLTSDPVEQAERYHHEARRALQETPVVAIVDAAERRSGRRLPFDLLEVSDVVFHPKSVLLLYREYARLLVGSGNLTFSGYGGNSELFVSVDLAYDQPADVAMLVAFDEHLVRILRLVRQQGTQTKIFREELYRRLPPMPVETPPATYVLLDSTTGPIIEQFAALLPANASITSIGMLAPFYERDDVAELDEMSVFGALDARVAKDAVFDIGVTWDNSQVQPSAPTELKDGMGQIWTWMHEDGGTLALEHLVPLSMTQNTLTYFDESGQRRRSPLDEVVAAVEQRAMWMQPSPVTFAPRQAVTAVSKRFSEVCHWLYPATRLVDGRPVHRPLHAKLLVVGYQAGASKGTLVLMGSPNMSKRALLMKSGSGQGNVELGMAFQLSASLRLRDFAPELIYAPASTVDLQEREFPSLGPNYSLAIEEATHDPQARTLRVTWSAQAAELSSWRLTYDGKQLAALTSAPATPVEIEEFVLSPSTAEVVLHVKGREYPAPILVTDLVGLPVTSAGATVGLDELLLLLGRRIGAERAMQIAERRAKGAGESDELNALFGEGFGPTDVFRAWWSVAEDLRDPSLPVLAFRLRLEGALGIGAAWTCMLDAMRTGTLSIAEVWFYGVELLHSLAEVVLPPLEDRDAKIQALSNFCERIRGDIKSIGFEAGAPSWITPVLKFYQAKS